MKIGLGLPQMGIFADVTALVEAAASAGKPEPLLYFNRTYRLIGGHP